MIKRPKPRKPYWNQAEMGWWERVYLIEVLRGLMITGGVFARNLGKFLRGRRGALTAYYPEENRPDYSPINRGRHVLTQRANGELQCVSCNMCATVCPAYCIEIVAKADFNDPVHPKSPASFAIDYSRCIFCGFCVEACPEDAIRMAPETPRLPGFDRDNMWGTVDLLKQWKPATDPAKPYPAPPAPPRQEGAA